MAVLLIKRGTRAQLNTAANNSQLLEGEPYFITDEDRIAIGTSKSTYQEYAKTSEVTGASGSMLALANNIVHSTPATTAANIEANTNSTDVWSYLLPSNTVIEVEGLLSLTTAAATTGVAIGVNGTTNASGTANLTFNTSIALPVTNAAAATAINRFKRANSTVLNTTIGVAILNTASTTDQGAQIKFTAVNRGSGNCTIRIKVGTEVNASAVTVLSNSTIEYKTFTV